MTYPVSKRRHSWKWSRSTVAWRASRATGSGQVTPEKIDLTEDKILYSSYPRNMITRYVSGFCCTSSLRANNSTALDSTPASQTVRNRGTDSVWSWLPDLAWEANQTIEFPNDHIHLITAEWETGLMVGISRDPERKSQEDCAHVPTVLASDFASFLPAHASRCISYPKLAVGVNVCGYRALRRSKWMYVPTSRPVLLGKAPGKTRVSQYPYTLKIWCFLISGTAVKPYIWRRAYDGQWWPWQHFCQ